MRAGEAAALAQVNSETLRYYERRGLLPTPDRSLGGHRQYSEEAVTTLRVIKAAQRLGFTLEEVAELLDTGRHHHQHRGDARLADRAQSKLDDVETKIADLQPIADTLRATIDAGCDDLVSCAGNSCCPIPFSSIATSAPAHG